MLKLRSVVSGYGQIHALKGVSLHLAEGEIVALIGANGAGKTTLLNTVSGVLPPFSGEITFMERRINGLPPEKLVRLGIAHVPQGRQLFSDMSVYENLLLGAYRQPVHGRGENLRREMEKVYDIFPILKERSRQPAGTLSGGEQQMLAIGRALMSRPRLLLLDEPSMGLAPIVIKEIFRVIGGLHGEGTTVLLVEQNARAALSVARRAYLLETGRIVLEGTAHELSHNPEVSRAYLGKGYNQMEPP